VLGIRIRKFFSEPVSEIPDPTHVLRNDFLVKLENTGSATARKN
jgi:hypothetical protein